MMAKLIVKGKEFDIEILDPELVKMITPVKKKTGYERVECGENYYWGIVDSRGEVVGSTDNRTESDSHIYSIADYYSDKTVAENNARADKLMRQLRRFSAERRDKEMDWANDDKAKYTIEFDYETKMLDVDYWYGSREFGTIFFETDLDAEQAIETFRDELMWYFTEYKDSL